MTAPPDPFASVVTARDVYDATRETQQEVRRALDRIDGHDQALAEIVRTQREHRARLDAIDRWRYAIPITSISAVVAGLAAIISVLVGA